MTQAEMVEEVEALTTQVEKIGGEVDSVIASAGQISPELEAAWGNLKGAVQTVDDKIPDAPTGQKGGKK